MMMLPSLMAPHLVTCQNCRWKHHQRSKMLSSSPSLANGSFQNKKDCIELPIDQGLCLNNNSLALQVWLLAWHRLGWRDPVRSLATQMFGGEVMMSSCHTSRLLSLCCWREPWHVRCTGGHTSALATASTAGSPACCISMTTKPPPGLAMA